jgi:hypothetical protein
MGGRGLGRGCAYLATPSPDLNSNWCKFMLRASAFHFHCPGPKSRLSPLLFLHRRLTYINGPYTAPKHIYSTHYSRGSTKDHPTYHEQSFEGSLG